MAGQMAPEIVDRVREANDIVAVVSNYVRLKRAGNTFKGLCPFHSEKTPSFTVSHDKQLFYCFGCQAGGNVFNFVMKIENLDFVGALRFLAERVGMRLPEEEAASPEEQARKVERKNLLRLTELASRFYTAVLERHRMGQRGRDYVANRGIAPETVTRFQLGFAPDSWDALTLFLRDRGADLALAERAGLLSKRREGGYYDRFRNRLMFPIRSSRGEAIAFGGRVVGDGEPKYLNSPETPLFHKGQNLYALNLAGDAIRKAGHAIIVEGYMDALTCHQYGFRQAVASLGTALTEAQARLLARWTNEVRIAYDADAAGQHATWRGLELLTAAGFRVRVVRMPKGDDPDSLLRREGAEAFGPAVEGAEALLDYKLRATVERFDVTTSEGRIVAAQEIAPVLANVESPVEREEYLPKAAALIGVSTRALEAEVARQVLEAPDGGRNDFPHRTQAKAGSPQALEAAEPLEIDLVRVLLAHPRVVPIFAAEVGMEVLRHPALKTLVAAMVAAAATTDETAGFRDGQGQLDEAGQAVLSALALSDDGHLRDVDPEEFVRHFRWQRLPGEVGRFESNVAEAAEAGDVGQLNDLLVAYKLLRQHYLEKP